jgi:hypothetical protein
MLTTAGLTLIPNGRVRLHKRAPVFPAESNAAGIMQVIGSPIQFAARAMQDLPPFHQGF